LKKAGLLFLIIFLLGAGLRTINLLRPVTLPSWREADICAVARSYYREGLNPFYPRIDWRGDGPGYAELEFPFYPWAMALLYKVFGIHETAGRVLAYLFSLIALAVFMLLARHLLPPTGAMVAALFYAFNPLNIFVATAIQPESLMLMWYLIAGYAFIRWIDEDSVRHYWLAVTATALAILAKAPAGHIGLFFAALLLWRKGWRALGEARVWIFGALALLPGVLWYWHAHGLWLKYGNSLGVSNEYHWAGWDLFTNPYFIKGLVQLELRHVWMLSGAALAIAGLLAGWKEKAVRYSLCWLLSAGVYYLAAARTTADAWAFYYHIPSVVPAALLIGAGFESLRQRAWPGLLTHRAVTLILLLCVGTTLALEIRQLRVTAAAGDTELYRCATHFAPELRQAGLILASGGPCRDADGYQVAYNASYFFYWLDRRGFNVCEEEQSLQTVRSFAERGAVYFIAEKQALKKKPGLEAELRANFPVTAECDSAVVFQLRAQSAAQRGEP
jgi:hypothetical protein